MSETTDQPAEFQEYDVPNVGTVIAPEGEPGYRVRLLNGAVTAYPAKSEVPCEANAVADITWAIANPAPLVVPVPASVDAWKLKAVIDTAGLTAGIVAAIAAMSEPQRSQVQAAWEGIPSFSRTSPTLIGLATALNLTSDQIDSLFRQAADISL